jgi:GNAT superfamily N-acetyltransferase
MYERGGLSAIYPAAQMIAIEKCPSIFSGSSPLEGFSSPIFTFIYAQEVRRLMENYTIDPTKHQLIVAKSDSGEIIGYVDIDRRDDSIPLRYPTPYVSDVIVRRDWRKRGVAQGLLQHCCEVCKSEWREPAMYLWVETSNLNALRLYNKLSFVPIRGESGPIDDPSRIKTWDLKGDHMGAALLQYLLQSQSHSQSHSQPESLCELQPLLLPDKRLELERFDRLLLRKTTNV